MANIDYVPRHLVKVAPDANNNKYYDMTPQGDFWTARFGRVGSSAQTRTYSRGQWNTKYNEKLRKGYVDQTDLVHDLVQEQTTESEPEYRPIQDNEIADIVNSLMQMARETVQRNYTVSSNQVTQAMVDTAQDIITGLINIDDIQTFNHELIRLFTTIPRKMGDVRDHTARTASDFSRIIQREQDLLDVMRGQIVHPTQPEKLNMLAKQHDQTILEALGLEFSRCTEDDIASIKVALGNCVDKFRRAWCVTNLATQRRFDQFVLNSSIKDTRLLFHGSRNENWWSILQSGLVLRPTNAVITGKMFGYGLYYAPKARKSLGYTSLSGSYWARGNSNRGYMGLMNVAYGKPYDVYSFESRFNSFDYQTLQKVCPGANCLHAHAGKMLQNDEIIVYKEEQCTIKYLVELDN